MSALYNGDMAFIKLMFPDEEECASIKDTINLMRENVLFAEQDKGMRFQLAATLVSHSEWMYIREGVTLLEELAAEELKYKADNANAHEIVVNEIKNKDMTSPGVNNDASEDKTINCIALNASNTLPMEQSTSTESKEMEKLIMSTSTEQFTPLLSRGVCVTHPTAPPSEMVDEEYSGVANERRVCKNNEEHLPNCNSENLELQQQENRANTSVSSSIEMNDWKSYSSLNNSDKYNESTVTVDSSDNDNSNTSTNNTYSNVNKINNGNANSLICLESCENVSHDTPQSSYSSWEEITSEMINASNTSSVCKVSERRVDDNNNYEKQQTAHNGDDDNNDIDNNDEESAKEQIDNMERRLLQVSNTVDVIAPNEMCDLAFFYYYLTVGYLKLHEGEKAGIYLEELLKFVTHNRQVVILNEYFQDFIKQTVTSPKSVKEVERTSNNEFVSETKSEKDVEHTPSAKVATTTTTKVEKVKEKEQQAQCKEQQTMSKGSVVGGIVVAAVAVIGGILWYALSGKDAKEKPKPVVEVKGDAIV